MAGVGRIFVGLAPPADVKAALVSQLEAVAGLPGRVVPPENWHVTLRFVGAMDETSYERLLAALDQTELGDPFEARVHGIGAFPNHRRATVLWAGIGAGTDALAGLAAEVEEVVVSIGCDPEDRPFHAHLTLSRIRPQQNVGRLVEVDLAPIPWSIDRISVFRSHLGPTGARYEQLEVFALGR